jgi:hypothetical protein
VVDGHPTVREPRRLGEVEPQHVGEDLLGRGHGVPVPADVLEDLGEPLQVPFAVLGRLSLVVLVLCVFRVEDGLTVGCPPRSTDVMLPLLRKLTRAHRARFEFGPRSSLGNSRAIGYTFLSAMVSLPVHWKLFRKPSKSAKNGSLLSPAANV